jgi:lipoprotein-anchoring transpeptidase ErfK/SrfK
MADVVGSGEGAEAAGEDVGQAEAGSGIAGTGAGEAAKAAAQAGPEVPEAVPEDTQTLPEESADAAAAAASEAAEPAAATVGAAVAETIVIPAQGPPAAAPAAAAAPPVPPVAVAVAAAPTEPVAASSGGPVPPGSVAAAPAAASASSGGFRLDRRKALVIGGAVVVVAGATAAALAASGGSGASGSSAASGTTGARAGSAGKSSAAASSAPAVPMPTITTVPADGATGVDPSKPITVQVLNGTIESVQLSGQDQTNGTLSTDGSSWTSANVLSVDSSYRLTVTAKNPAGKSSSSAVSFQTLKPSATFGVSSVVPPRGSTVGVGQPIRVTFSNYVPDEYRAALEKACTVSTSPAVAGAWYWVSNSSDGAVVDWRPENFWAVNTQVSIAFDLDGVRLGEHQFGVENYAAHEFTISDRDLRLTVDKDSYKATCYENGQVIRTFPIDTGMTTEETLVTYTGTMAVLGKGNPVEMKGNYGPGDTYDDFVNWATQITWSGTYVHAAPWDGDIGDANDDSHGCIHCRTEDAEWYYGKVIDGDVVTVTGSRTRTVAVDNGICTFTLDWPTLLRGSAYGATVNGKPVSA